MTKYRPASFSYVPAALVSKLEARIRRNITRRIDPAAPCSRRTDVDAGRYSSRCTYRKIEHIVTYAVGLAIHGRTVVLRVDGDDSRRLTLPAGWGWKIENGLAVLYRTATPDCDYHLEARDFGRSVAVLMAVAVANYDRRMASAKLESDIAALAPLCKVTISDSLAAGNCRAGTLDFAARNGIENPDVYRGLPADKLLRVGGRAAVAARMAVLRQTEICI